MSTVADSRWRQYTSIAADGWGVLLALLFLAVITGAVSLASWAAGLGAEPVMAGESTSTQAAGGAGWALAEVAVAVAILGVIAVWTRLPEWIQDVIKKAISVVVLMAAGVYTQASGVFWLVVTLAIGYYFVYKAMDAYDIYWLLNDAEAVALAVFGAAFVGVVLPIPFLLAGILGLTVYDHVFADRQTWMFSLLEGMLRARLPVIVLALPRLRVPWEAIVGAAEETDEELEDLFESGRGFGIGMADLLLPAAFAVAVSASGVWPVVGVTAGVVVAAFRLRWEMLNWGGGAGMPALTSGMLGGWAVGALVVMVA